MRMLRLKRINRARDAAERVADCFGGTIDSAAALFLTFRHEASELAQPEYICEFAISLGVARAFTG
jgi:hypothetical protein